jgi:hypothetical protein
MYQDTQQRRIIALTFLLSIPCSLAHTDSTPSPLDSGPQESESFVQYSTGGGTVIAAKPPEQRPANNPVFEDYLHVIVACMLALLLITLLGFVIRRYGLSLHPLTRSVRRSKLPNPAAGDAEKHPETNVRSQTGLGLKAPAPGTGGLDDSELPEKPRAVYLKWR